jgi:SAM-dependent methyltransferase
MLHAARRIRSSAGLRIGRIRSSRPLSTIYGFDRGTPIDRLYIEAYLAECAGDIGGNVLEVGDDTYSRRFGGDRIRKQDVLHVHAGNPVATIVGDLAAPGILPEDAFDCIILTQTLQYIFDLESAIRELHRALRPGGVLLVSVPALSPICADEWQESHYWLFTPLSLRRLLESSFDPHKVAVSPFGNLYAATTFLHGAAVEEANRKKLEDVMPGYAIVICARAVA